jgi:competence protein ComEC
VSVSLAGPLRRLRRLDALEQAILDWAEAERGRLALWLPVVMLAGNALYFALLFEPPLGWGVASLGVAGVATLALWRRAIGRALALATLAAALGFAAAQIATALAPPLMPVSRHGTFVVGQVRAVEPLPEGVRVTLQSPRLDDGPPQPRRVRLRLRAEDPLLPQPGDTLRLKALLSPPEPPAYPGGWDLQRDAYFSALGAYGFGLTRAQVLDRAAPSSFGARVEAVRSAVAARVVAEIPGPAGAICSALLTGGTAAIPEIDRQAFRDSGLAHLLAIAGLHIGIVMGLFFGLTRVLVAGCEWTALRWPGKAVAAVVALLAGGGYMLLTGAHVPIVRSFAMACLVTLGILVGRRAISLRGLALAMAALLLIAPAQAMGVSFQMSFSAVLALIAGYDALRPALARLRGGGLGRRVASHVLPLALTSALAGTASAPFAAYHFGQVQLYNVLANVAAVPLTAFWIMPAGLVGLFLMPLHAEAWPLAAMAWGVEAVLWIARTVAALPAATFAVPHGPPWGLAAVALGMAWLGLWRTRLRLAGLPVLLLGVLSPALATPPDALLAADGKLAALRADGAMFVQMHTGVSGFTFDAWRQMWAGVTPRALPADAAGLNCDDTACTLGRAAGGAEAMLLLTGSRPPDCRAAAVLSLGRVRLDCAAPGPAVVDRLSLMRDGAYAVWLSPAGARIESDRSVRGVRPWVPPPE